MHINNEVVMGQGRGGAVMPCGGALLKLDWPGGGAWVLLALADAKSADSWGLIAAAS